MTSSNTSRAPHRDVSSRSISRNPTAGPTTPMLPATGSTMTAAISLPLRPEELADAGDIVELGNQRQLGDRGWHPGAVRGGRA